MRISVVLSTLFALGALAVPLNKRVLIEDIVVVTVTDFVYVDELPTSTSTTSSSSGPPAQFYQQPATTTPVVQSPVYTPPVVPSSTSTPPPPPPPPTTSPIPAYTPPPPAVSPAPAPSPANGGSPALDGAPTTLVPNLDVTSPTYAAIAVVHHNVHRANHSAPALTYNQTLADWAQQKAESCVWNEDMVGSASGVGMNIAQGTWLGAGNLSAVITDMWYNSEIDLFPSYGVADLDVGPNSNFQNWGHFSQVVWDGTTAVGCGSAPCGPGTSIGSGYFVACMYYPPGNFLGDFTQVGKPLGQPTVAVIGDQIVTM